MELLKDPSLSEHLMKETEADARMAGPEAAKELAAQGIRRAPGWHSDRERGCPCRVRAVGTHG